LKSLARMPIQAAGTTRDDLLAAVPFAP